MNIGCATGTVFTDPGAEAYDNRDRNITDQLTAWGLSSVVTSNPTESTNPYQIMYSVVDSAKNKAVPAYRRVEVNCRDVSAPYKSTCHDIAQIRAFCFSFTNKYNYCCA